MAFYRNHIVAAEPYEDSQGPDSPTETAPEELQAFYEDMERRDILERKLSKGRSNSGVSLFSRKSLKRWTTSPPPVPSTQADLPRIPSNSQLQHSEEEYEAGYVSEPSERSNIPRLASSRSIIADSRESAPSVDVDAWAAVPLPSFKVRYPLHNPFGPRRYRNHHLIPPSMKKPSMRPPTFFSPSFPPMHTSSAPEHLDDRPESTNTNSYSPLETPTSSQTRVADGGKPRSRKTSQTAPDTVDLLDVTDPWGTNWHHQSPYDIGQTTAATSDAYDIPNRTRRASMTAMQSRHKSVAPSPLSQSTSAVHLQPIQPIQPEIHIPRKLSKRRTPTAENVFASKPTEPPRKFTSAPATPVETRYVASPQDSEPSDFTSLPKRMSVAPAPLYSSMQPTPKKEKRGSMLNRLAKKFSLLKRSSDDHTPVSDWWHHVDSNEFKGYTNAFDNVDRGRTSPEKSSRDSAKRVPPPSVDNLPDPSSNGHLEHERDAKRLSLTSLDAPYSMGRLTITNPDLLPDSTTGTPAADGNPPLPPEKPKDMLRTQSQSHATGEPSTSLPFSDAPQVLSPFPSSDRRSRLDKPLPPPQLATPDVSQIRLSDVQAAQAFEQMSPPPSRAPSPAGERDAPVPLPADNLKHETQQPVAINGTGGDKSGSVLQDRIRTTSPEPVSPKDDATPKKSSSLSKAKNSPSKDESPQTETLTPDRTAPRPPSVRPQSRNESAKKSSPQHTSRNAEASSSRHPIPERYRNPQEERVQFPEASTSTLQPPNRTDRSRSHSNSHAAPAPMAVPFPTASRLEEYEGSPLSTSSMLANPPTPYDNRMSIAMSDQTPPTLPPKSIYEGKSPQNQSPINPSPSRQTETFKLVRSSSGNVYASNQTITAAGEQWEVVESVEARGKKDKSSSRPKDQEYKSRDRDYRGKDYDHRSREHERRSRDYEYRPWDDRKSRDYDRWSRGHEQQSRDDYRVRDEAKSRDDRSKDEQRARDEQRAWDDQRNREALEERLREEKRAKETRERAREDQRIREAKEEQKMRDERREREERRARDEKRSREEKKAREERRTREERRAKEEQREREEKERRIREEQREREEKERAREERRIREEQREREEKERAREERRSREEQREREEKGRAREEKKVREEKRAKEEQRIREEQKMRDEQKAREDERVLQEEHRQREYERRSLDYEHKSRDNHRSRDYNQRSNQHNHRSTDYARGSNDYEQNRDYEYKSKDYEHNASRESSKGVDPTVDNTDYYRSSHRSTKQPVYSSRDSSNVQSNNTINSPHRDGRSRHQETKSSRTRDDYLERHTERNPIIVESSSSSSSSTNYGVVERSEPVYGSAQTNIPHLRLERNPSLTARPTSELPSAAEMNAVRAKESWEMERLWKARSMYGLETNAQTTNYIPGSSSSVSSRSDDLNTQSAVHGSSHTAYVVQTPFQGGLGAQIYHSMPTGPPPIIYSSPASIPSIPDNLSSYEPYEQAYRSYATSPPSECRSPTAMPIRAPLTNPLPEPPRESPFEITGLKNTKSSNRHSQNNDYWTKFNGITATH